MNTYNSIIPSEMTASEIRNLCADLLTAKNWKQENAEVMLESGERKVIPVNKLSYYQEFHRVETGGINSKTGRPSAKEFALEQIAPYFVDPSTCGLDPRTKACEYLTKDGRMCVAGKNFTEDALIKFKSGTIGTILSTHTQEQIFKPESVDILTKEQWIFLQEIHDGLAVHKDQLEIQYRINCLNLFTYQELVDYSEKLKSLSPA